MPRTPREPADTVPYAPGRLPLLGHLIPMATNPLRFFQGLAGFGPVVRIGLGPRTGYVVNSVPLVRQLLLDRAGSFDKGGPVFDALVAEVGNGLAKCPAALHHRMRPLLQPAFRTNLMPRYAEVTARRTLDHIRAWEPGQILDVSEEMSRLTTSALAASLLTDPVSQGALGQLQHDLPISLRGIAVRAAIPWASRIPLPANRRYDRAKRRTDRAIAEIVAARGTDDPHQDLVSLMLAPEASDLMDRDLVRANVWEFITGGTDTTGALLAWTLHLLVTHPVRYTELQAEIDGTLGPRTPTYDDLAGLPCLRRTLTEALRLHPPVWILSRTTRRTTELGGHLLPAGADVYFCIAALHRDPAAFPSPDTFDPDRWLPDRTTREQRDAFMPFAVGARKCIGDVFGLTEASIALSTILRRWRFAPAPGSDPSPRPSLSLHPRRLRLRLHPREGASAAMQGATCPLPTTPQPN